MARKGRIALEGEVLVIQGGGLHRVKLDKPDVVVLAKLSGKLQQFGIKVVAGDRVRVEVSEADPTKGSIVYRLS